MYMFEKGNINLNSIQKPSVIGSYKPEDVIFLLKDISDLVTEKSTAEREKAIQSGLHYSEMLPIEYIPSKEYTDLFYYTLKSTSQRLAFAIGIVAEKIYRKRGKDFVLVSLARAGTPLGILVKRYLKKYFGIDIPHYSISIIRGKGIDENALLYIIKNHPGKQIQFFDGWTGKGAIVHVLSKAISQFNTKYDYNLDFSLAVVADPCDIVSICGTKDDYLIPNACLNSTISGLISRTFHRSDIIGSNDFHGVKFYKELKDYDLSNYYIDEITSMFDKTRTDVVEEMKKFQSPQKPKKIGLEDVLRVKNKFGISDINLIKPGIGETTRVLLRRVPWKVLVRSKGDPEVRHILMLAKEKKVEVQEFGLKSYLSCGIIKNLGRDDI